MRFIIWKIFLPVVLLGLDVWWLYELNAGSWDVLQQLGEMVALAHFPFGKLLPQWATFLSGGAWRQGWLLLAPLLLNTAFLSFALGAWIDWRLEERARGSRGVLDSLMRSFGDPRGLVGLATAFVMNRGNRRLNHYCVAALSLQPEDKVLDVGFGGGASFSMILAKLGVGSLSAVDTSEDMVRRARRRYGFQTRSGRLRLAVGSVDQLPLPESSFDKVLAVNTIYFWPDLTAGFKEIQRVLRPGGTLVVGLRPQKVVGKFRDFGFKAYSERQLAGALYNARFSKIEVEDRPDGKMGAKIFTAWSGDQGPSASLKDSEVESMIRELEKNLGSRLDVEI